MKRALLLALLGVSSTSLAAPPGVLNGRDITSDFATSRLAGLQTNYTGVGDVTTVDVVPNVTEGSELNAMYLAKDATNLYVGLTGNLLEAGNTFLVLIDNPSDFGQVSLLTQGISGPPFAVQMAGQVITVNDGGTPGDDSDDTYSVDPNSGTRLPGANDPGFTGWDYALEVNAQNGQLSAYQWTLLAGSFPFPNGALCNYGDGRVPCDPTPGNPNDAPLDLFATRTLVGQSPLADGNEALENNASQGFVRGGFDNTNVLGVTDVNGTGAATATTGLEIAIPLANIGDTGLFGGETIHMVVLTLEGDEFQVANVSTQLGAVLNQTLPAVSSPDCGAGNGLGLRPDLSSSVARLAVDLTTLSFIAPAAVLDGDVNPSDYTGGAPAVVQTCPTSGGDATQQSDTVIPNESGSELNALYTANDDQFLYLGLTGNLAAGGTSLNLFIDTDAAGVGDASIEDFAAGFALSGTFQAWDTAVFSSDPNGFRVQSTDFGGGFYFISPAVNAPGAERLELDFVVNASNQADRVRVVLTDADITEQAYDFDISGGPGTYNLSIPLDGFAFSNPGGIAGLDTSQIQFFQLAGGFNNGDPGLPLDITFTRLALAGDDAGEHVLDFQPGASGFSQTQVEDFSTIQPFATYVSWGDPNVASFTNEGNGLRVQTTGGFGGGVFDISPNVALSAGGTVQLDVTVNPGSSGGGVLLVLADGDDTQLRWSWFGLLPGESYNLEANIADGTNVNAGSVAGFDFSNVSFFQLQGDFAVTDVTFENLAAESVLPGVAPILNQNGNALPNGPLDVLGNGRFPSDAAVQYDYAYGINLSYTPLLAFVDQFDLVNDTFAFRGAVALDSNDAMLGDIPGGDPANNPNGLLMAVNNRNINGVLGCADENQLCFGDDPNLVGGLALSASTGVEMAIPLADLGLSSSDLPKVINLVAAISDRDGFVSNQSLPTMRNGSFERNQVVNPGIGPVDLTAPESGPSAGGVVSDFASFLPTGTYGVWGTAIFTSGANDFRVESTDFGGCFFDITPNIDVSGGTEVVLDVTLNPANQTDRIVLVLTDGDGTTRVFRWDGLSNGSQQLRRDLRDFVSEDNAGSEPGLDLSNLSFFNIAGAFHNGNPGLVFDVTFDNLELVGGVRNFESRAARICLSTVPGDADCDGDNDIADYLLLQQCGATVGDPVFPMECSQIDLVRDDIVDQQDLDTWFGIFTGP